MSVVTTPRSGSSPAPPPPPRGDGYGPAGPPAPPPPFAVPQAPHRRPRWWRIVLGAVIVLLCAAGGTAVFVVEQVKSISDALNQNKSLGLRHGVLASAGFGGPETLLLVGNDTRSVFKYYRGGYVGNLANEMLLVRLDSSKDYISMMSLPRELMAQIYNWRGQLVGVNRLNSALSYGSLSDGINGLVITITRDLGLSINHVIETTFTGFEKAVNEMGCVYTTVDQRYYHVNVPGGSQYQEINLQPGYQKLCGPQAEQFVSYRHTDTSLVRDARDQSFLMDVKKEYGPTLFDNVGKFERIFGKAVQTDPGLKSYTSILSLANTLIAMSGRHVRQVPFQATLQATGSNYCNCDTATPQQIHASVHAFLYGGSPIPPAKSVAAQAHAVHNKRVAARLPLVPTPSSAVAQARAAASKLGGFPLEYPQVEDRGGSGTPPDLRVYTIVAPDGTVYPTYVGVFAGAGLGNYYDVQGSMWKTAPQFDSPDQVIHVGARTYFVFYDSQNIRMIAWYEHNAVYWVRNSLTDSIGNGEMLAIAEQTQPFVVAGSGPQHTTQFLQAAKVPFPIAAKPKVPLTRTIGGAAALVTLAGLALLLILAIRRFVDLHRARLMLGAGQQIGARLPAGAALPITQRPSPVPLLAGQSGHAEMGTPFLPPRPASGRWTGGPKVYRRSELHRTGLIVSVVVVLALLCGGAAAAVLLTRHAAPARVHHAKRAVGPLIPTVPVVVLNATSVPGAAGRLATSLRADHISVPTVGNLQETVPPGNEILYAPGERNQAERLSRLLPHQVATIAPIDPVSAAAAGSGAELVVVITS